MANTYPERKQEVNNFSFERLMTSNDPASNGDKMTKKSKRGISDYLFWCLLALLALKVLGLTKAWFNIDPEGINFSFDVVGAVSLVLFGLLWTKLDGIRNTIADQGERIARLEGRLTATK